MKEPNVSAAPGSHLKHSGCLLVQIHGFLQVQRLDQSDEHKQRVESIQLTGNVKNKKILLVRLQKNDKSIVKDVP